MAGLNNNPIYKVLRRTAEENGAPFTIQQKGKHPKFIVNLRGRVHKIVFSWSPSDHRAPISAQTHLERGNQRSDPRSRERQLR